VFDTSAEAVISFHRLQVGVAFNADRSSSLHLRSENAA
jgi:hypothetical protein